MCKLIWTKKAILLMLVAVTATVIVGGCGGSDDSGGETGTSASGSASVDETGEPPGKRGGREAGAGEEGADAGSEKSGSSAGEPISKAEFIKTANDICVRRVTEILGRVRLDVSRNVGGGKRVKDVQAESVDTVFVPGLEAEVREIKELGAPAGDEAKVEAFLRAMEEGIDLTKKKNYRASNIEGLGQEYEHAGKLAHGYELDKCALGGG